jgi:hypothetical protein
MSNLIKILIALSALSFVVAILEALFSFQLFRVDPEGYSRACSNLALIAIALALITKKE